MKLKRICALALCSALCAGLVTLTASADSATDAIKTHKEVSGPDTDGNYTITLEAYVEGDKTYNSGGDHIPLDIVIAMDVSDDMGEWITVADKNESLNSLDTVYGKDEGVYQLRDDYAGGTNIWRNMKYENGKWYYRYWHFKYITSGPIEDNRWTDGAEWGEVGGRGNVSTESDIQVKKSDAEKIAIWQFLESLQENATENGVIHNVSIVKYGGNINETTGNDTYGNGKNYSQIVIEPQSANNSTFKDTIYNTTTITYGGNANLGNGMARVQAAMNNMTRTDAKKVVVVISGGTIDGDKSEATSIATSLKEKNGADIYTFCINESKNASAVSTLRQMASDGKCTTTVQSSQLEKELSGLFELVTDPSESGNGANATLGKNSELTDTVTKYFDVISTSAHTEKYTAVNTWVSNEDTWDVTESTNEDGETTLSVTGFDYSGETNWVGPYTKDGVTTYQGNKMVLTIKVKPKSGFLGGNQVPTNNMSKSAVYYYDGEVAKSFGTESPKVDVDVPILEISGMTDKNIYLLGTLTDADMLGGVTATGNGAIIKWDQKDNNYGLESWQNEFVNISFTAQSNCDGKTDGNYSVTCTVTAKTDANNTATVTDNKNVYVFKPELTYSDETIYLGNEPSFEYTEQWKHDNTLDTAVTMIGQKPELNNLGYDQTDFTSCQTVNLSTIKVGNTTLTGNDLTACVTAESFEVHVKTPEIEGTEQTIYYGNSTKLTAKITGWKDCACNGNKPSASGDSKTPNFTYTSSTTSVSPAECQKYTVTLTSIGKAKNLTGYTDEFTVHVAKPTFTTDNVTIYRGNDTNLNSRVKVTEWKCQGGIGHTAQTLDGTGAPDIDYTFTGVTTPKEYKPTDCTELTVTAKVGNKEGWTDIPKFTVHVLQPVFTVTTQDVWADYGTIVDLAANCLVKTGSVPYVLAWKDANSSHASNPDPDDETEPAVSATTFTFTPNPTVTVTNGKYTVGENDQTFNVTNLAYTLSNGHGMTTYTPEFAGNNNKDAFTVHVNKFKLTINKTWDGADCYKQDAIFTVTRGTGTSATSFKVVIPKEKTSVTIGGLLCGQTYTVTEDGNWSWRWTSKVTGNDSVKHAHGISNTKPEEHTKTVSVENTLNTSKTQWLSGDWWCQNTCTGTSIKKTDTDDLKKKTK